MSHLHNFIATLNTSIVRRAVVAKVQNTKFIRACLKKLIILGYIQGFTVDEKQTSKLYIFIKIDNNITNKTPIKSIRGVSKPGKRVYIGYKTLHYSKTLNNLNTAQTIILSTSYGLLTQKEATLKKIGGEILFTIS